MEESELMLLPSNKCGIYYLKCNSNKKLYIGSSIKIRKRLLRHIGELQTNRHCNPILQNIWNKYGENSFCCGVLEIVKDRNILNLCEKFWIDNNIDRVVNIILDPRNLQGKNNPFFGKIHTDETRKKMSNNHCNFNGINNPFSGKSHSPSSLAKMSLSKGSLSRDDILRIRILAKTNTISKTADIAGISYELARLIVRGKCYQHVR